MQPSAQLFLKIASIGFPSHHPPDLDYPFSSLKVLALGCPHCRALSQKLVGSGCPASEPSLWCSRTHLTCANVCLRSPLLFLSFFLKLFHWAFPSQEGLLLFVVMICWQFLGSLALKTTRNPLVFSPLLQSCYSHITLASNLYSGFM